MEISRYARIIRLNDATPKTKIVTMVTTTNSNCRQVSFRLKFLIFKENIGIGETKRAESTTVVISKAVEDDVSISNHWL